MARLALVAFTAFAVVMNAASAGVANPTDTDIEVLKAALTQDCERADPKYLVLSTNALVDDDATVPQDWAESTALTARLHELGKTKHRWTGFQVCSKVLLRNGRQLDAFFAGAGDLETKWRKFYAVYPGAIGMLEVSAPAYSSDGQRAVLSISHSCGSLCGSGELVEMEKVDGKWRRARDQGAWIS